MYIYIYIYIYIYVYTRRNKFVSLSWHLIFVHFTNSCRKLVILFTILSQK